MIEKKMIGSGNERNMTEREREILRKRIRDTIKGILIEREKE